MFNEAQVSLTGYVATQPTLRATSNGIPVLSMRVAWTPRRLDRVTGEWSDWHTSYISVTCWRKLASNAAMCLHKGDAVIVKGRLSVRPYTDKNGVERSDCEVEAASVGPDLSRGVAVFQRIQPPVGKTAEQHAAELGANGLAGPGPADLAGPGPAGSGPADLASAEPDLPDDGDMFDEDGIDALAREAEGAGAPF